MTEFNVSIVNEKGALDDVQHPNFERALKAVQAAKAGSVPFQHLPNKMGIATAGWSISVVDISGALEFIARFDGPRSQKCRLRLYLCEPAAKSIQQPVSGKLLRCIAEAFEVFAAVITQAKNPPAEPYGLDTTDLAAVLFNLYGDGLNSLTLYAPTPWENRAVLMSDQGSLPHFPKKMLNRVLKPWVSLAAYAANDHITYTISGWSETVTSDEMPGPLELLKSTRRWLAAVEEADAGA